MSVPKSIGGKSFVFLICLVCAVLFTCLAWRGWFSGLAAYFWCGAGFYAKALEDGLTCE
jgi:hypothetical protein